MADAPPELSNVLYDDLVVDAPMGPFTEHVGARLAGRLSGPIGAPADVALAPPAVFPVLFLHALRRAMGGIPAGSVLAKQELEFHDVLPVGSDVAITVSVGAKEVKRDRPFVTIEFDVRRQDGTQVVTGRKIIVWPTGPGEVA